MLKPTGLFMALLLLVTLSLTFTCCKKDLHKKPFEVRTKTRYRVSPVTPAPLVINDTTYVGFAHFPGGGTGTATYMDTVTTFFNQLVYGTSPDAPPAGSVAAPIADVPGYVVTGAPLPLIQASDFAGLTTLTTVLDIPADVNGKIINQVISNETGDAVFVSAITGSGTTYPISETQVGFNGNALIVGGRGRFAHAEGEVAYSGYYNITNANDAAYNAAGWIRY